jgi:ApaG protein
MIQQITKGIKISVSTKFGGNFIKNNIINYAFSYIINIENHSKDTVQLLTRHWKIIESNRKTQFINGYGVLGEKPIVKPGGGYKYSSGCLITSSIGLMSGVYTMINFSNTNKFNVNIPSFKLNVPFILN